MAANPAVVAAAVGELELGFAAFALRANAKIPVTEHGFKNATTKPEWIATQLEAPGAGNYGITWPESSDRVVVIFDLDNGADGRERPWQDRLLDLIRRIGPLPATKATTTPSGGRHAFYRWPKHVPIPDGDELFGFTVRWPGRGYVVGPGSTIDGVTYLEGPEHAIADLPPQWVAAAIAERSAPRADGSTLTVTGAFVLPDIIPSGRRYATVRDYVASRYNSGLTESELWDLVRTQVAPRFAVPKSETDLRGDFARVIAKIAQRLGPPRHGAPAIPVGPLEDAPLTEFASQPIDWLWPAWLPRGVVTLMDGNPGVSKSTLVADLAARITIGGEWPDGTSVGDVGRVMWITTEDDPGRVLRPRIEAAGGDASLVRFVKSEVVFPSGAGAFKELVVQRASEPLGLALVILDPLFSHIEASVRTIADAEMRKGVMNPLGDAAQAADVAILVVRHFNKDRQADALNRGAGSLGGIVGAARALWTVAVDAEDETGETKAVGVAKLNYAKPQPPLRYRVVDRLPPGWVTGSVSGIEWLGAASVSITTMMAEGSSVGDAVRELEEILTPGPLGASAAEAKMRARGYSRDATKGAKKRLGVISTKAGMTGGWLWTLPQPASSDKPVTSENTEEAEEADPSLRPPLRRGSRARTATLSTSSIDSHPFEGVEEVATGGLPAPARAREGWVHPCRDYEHHRDDHYRVAGGWSCRACYPEEASA